jgi:hypothetical protein
MNLALIILFAVLIVVAIILSIVALVRPKHAPTSSPSSPSGSTTITADGILILPDGRQTNIKDDNKQVLNWGDSFHLKLGDLFLNGDNVDKSNGLGSDDAITIRNVNKDDGQPVLIGDRDVYLQNTKNKQYFNPANKRFDTKPIPTTQLYLSFGGNKTGPVKYGDPVNIYYKDDKDNNKVKYFSGGFSGTTKQYNNATKFQLIK